MGNSTRITVALALFKHERYREIQGDTGRYREIQGDTGRYMERPD
jgi:hypothetical protein